MFNLLQVMKGLRYLRDNHKVIHRGKGHSWSLCDTSYGLVMVMMIIMCNHVNSLSVSVKACRKLHRISDRNIINFTALFSAVF